MLSTGLEFAPGTTDECKHLVRRLFQPGELLSAYRTARQTFKTGDLVLRVSEHDPSGFEAEPRIDYVRRIKELTGKMPMLMSGVATRSAHGVAQLPFESDAMWLVVVRGTQAVPIMCVVFATPYELAASAN